MKVEIDTAALADAVAWTSRVIDARPSNPILAGGKLEANDGTLQFSAFNYATTSKPALTKPVPYWFRASCWPISPNRCVRRKRTWSPTAPR